MKSSEKPRRPRSLPETPKTTMNPKLPPGTHPGFAKLPSKTGVYRCKLVATTKRRPEHADYAGKLRIANGIAQVFIWLHTDGSLGLRLEKIKDGHRNC